MEIEGRKVELLKQRNLGKAKGTFLQSLRMFVFAALILSGSSQAMEKSELCALLWFLEFTLSKQAPQKDNIATCNPFFHRYPATI